ncbi:hypothetical protein [Symbioplanes lichenis]|uniref:hypothetical protein n=1 Tax=Symbioplanes lichenis TaxID=1629072 RepID=UPI00273A3EA4|nr:hypothetical protein [Actinoplanes lichenis]
MPFAVFVRSLNRYRVIPLELAIDTVLARQGHLVCATEWGKPLGHGLYEFRLRRSLATVCQEAGVSVPADAPTGGKVLLGVFFAVHGDRIVLLLGGCHRSAHADRARGAARGGLIGPGRMGAARAWAVRGIVRN